VAAVDTLLSRRAAAFPELPPTSLLLLAAQHSYAGLWPATEAELREVGISDPALTHELTGTKGGLAEGSAGTQTRVKGAEVGEQLVYPDLSLCVEYTGQSLGLDEGGQSALRPKPGAAEPSATIPAEITAMISALPSATAMGMQSPSPNAVEKLCERLMLLPDRYEDLALTAGGLGASALAHGGKGNGWRGGGSRDIFSVRHKQQA